MYNNEYDKIVVVRYGLYWRYFGIEIKQFRQRVRSLFNVIELNIWVGYKSLNALFCVRRYGSAFAGSTNRGVGDIVNDCVWSMECREFRKRSIRVRIVPGVTTFPISRLDMRPIWCLRMYSKVNLN